jgi:diguanylate cyclase
MPSTLHPTLAPRRAAPARASAPRARALRVAWLALALLATLEALHDIGVIGGRSALFDDWAHSIVLLAATVLCFAGATEPGRHRQASFAFGAGLACWVAGDTWWTLFYEHDPHPPFPSFADALWLSWYPLTALGIALLIRHHVSTFHLHRWMDGLAVMLIVLTPCAALFLAPAVEQSREDVLGTVVVVSYPILDALLIGGVLGVYGLLDWHVTKAWLVLGAGCVLMAAGDGLFAVQEERNGAVGASYDFTWPMGALLIALSVRLAIDVPARRPESIGWRAIVLPLAAQALAAGIQVYGLFHEMGNAERLVTLTVLIVAMVQIIVARPRTA